MRQGSITKYAVSSAVLVALLPVVLTYTALAFYARNIPMFDDYLALLRFAVNFHDAPSNPARLTLVVAAQHSEYKLIFEHAITAAELALTGRLALCVGFSLFSDVAGLRFLSKRLHETEAAARHHQFPADWGAALAQAQARGLYVLPPSTE